jgi:CheY-like chemotaxis protein
MKKVLVIDDDWSIRQILQVLLNDLGLDILEARHGSDGLRIAQQQRPDAILLDWKMPGMDGLTVLQHLRSSSVTKSIPVIMLTSDAHLLSPAQISQLGVIEVIAKPFESRTLCQRIARAIGQDLPDPRQEGPLSKRHNSNQV